LACKLFSKLAQLGELANSDQTRQAQVAAVAGLLPPCAREHFTNSAGWRRDFVECFRRLAARLSKTGSLKPNCTGEEMALNLAIDVAERRNDDANLTQRLEALPQRDQDRSEDPFDLVRECEMEDADVTMLHDAQMGWWLLNS